MNCLYEKIKAILCSGQENYFDNNLKLLHLIVLVLNYCSVICNEDVFLKKMKVGVVDSVGGGRVRGLREKCTTTWYLNGYEESLLLVVKLVQNLQISDESIELIGFNKTQLTCRKE